MGNGKEDTKERTEKPNKQERGEGEDIRGKELEETIS